MRNANLSKLILTAWLSVCFAAAAPAQHGGGGGGGGGGHSGGGSSSGGGGGHASSGGGHVSSSGGGSGHASGGGHAGATSASGASNSHYAGSAYGTQAYMQTGHSAHPGWTGVSGWQEPPASPSHVQITWRGVSSTNSASAARRGVPSTRVTMQRFANDGMRSRHHHHGRGNGDGDFDGDDGFFFPGFGFGFGFFGGASTCFFSGISADCFFNGFFPPPFISPVFGPGGLDGFAEPWAYGPLYAPGDYVNAQAAPGSDEDVVGYAPVPPPEAPEAMAEEAAPLTLIFLVDGTNFAVTDYWLAGGRLHYITSYGGENSVAFEKFDLQKTVDENYKLGILFSLRPAPAPDSAEPPDSAPAPPPAPAASPVSPQPPAPPAS